MWNIVQRYMGLYQNCALEANELAVDECWTYSYLIRTFYLLIMSNLFFIGPATTAVFYSLWKNGQEVNGAYQQNLDDIAASNEENGTTRSWPW